jgi:hypothetical protein
MFHEGIEQVWRMLGAGCWAQDRNRLKACWVQVRRKLGADWERVGSRLREDGEEKRILFSSQDMVGVWFKYCWLIIGSILGYVWGIF